MQLIEEAENEAMTILTTTTRIARRLVLPMALHHTLRRRDQKGSMVAGDDSPEPSQNIEAFGKVYSVP